MPPFFTMRHALATASLLVLAAAQQCYYPDGQPSSDTPCGTGSQSSCCGASSFCMDNGLCFDSGLVSRGSCTDKTWQSSACTQYCKTASPSTSIALTPCTEATFVCGLNASACENPTNIFTMAGGSSFVLRASQVAALIEPVLNKTQSQNSTDCPQSTSPGGMYTSAQMAGLGCGLGIPLLVALCTVGYFLFRERPWRRPSVTEPYIFSPAPASTIQHPALRTAPSIDVVAASRALASRDGGASTRGQPTFLDQYQMSDRHGAVSRAELDGSPVTTPVATTFPTKEGEFF